jgi:hypothetical protein
LRISVTRPAGNQSANRLTGRIGKSVRTDAIYGLILAAMAHAEPLAAGGFRCACGLPTHQARLGLFSILNVAYERFYGVIDERGGSARFSLSANRSACATPRSAARWTTGRALLP